MNSEPADKYELYRVILDYEALQDGFADRIEDLNVTLTEIDAAAGMTRGQTQKLLRKLGANDFRPSAQRKYSRGFAWETLGKTLKGTGLALALIVDDERFAPVKERLMIRARPPRKPTNAGSPRPTWLFRKSKAREMGKKRMSGLTESQRKRLARKAGKASGKSRRLRSRLKQMQAISCKARPAASLIHPADSSAPG